MLAVHWVNNTCAGVKIVLLVHREDKVPPPPLYLSLSPSLYCLPLSRPLLLSSLDQLLRSHSGLCTSNNGLSPDACCV